MSGAMRVGTHETRPDLAEAMMLTRPGMARHKLGPGDGLFEARKCLWY